MKISFQYLARNLLLLLLLSFLPLALTAQEAAAGSCAEKLQTAQNLFDRGQVEQVAGLLQECLKSGFNREESLAAYKLIIQTYLFEDELEKADSAMLAFLRRNPEYVLSETDHSSFVHLFNTFQVKPLVQISLHFGTSLPFRTFTVSRNVPGFTGMTKFKAQSFNLYGSLEAKFKLNEKIELNIEPGYSQLGFTIDEDFLDIGSTYYSEKQSRIEIPVSATYNIKTFGKFTPYARLGAGPSILLSSVATAEYIPRDINSSGHKGSSIDRMDSRIRTDIFAQVGAGIKYKTRGGYIFAELRSGFGIINQTVRQDFSSDLNNLPSANELNTFYYYDDDDFNLNAVNFSIGYTQIFYKPSKRGE